MLDSSSDNAADLLARYSDAPASMPEAVRDLAEGELGGAIVLYALSDLDSEFKFRRLWIALGRHALVLIREAEGQNSPQIVSTVQVESVGGIQTAEGLSCSSVTVVSVEGEALIAPVHYTRRHHASFEALGAAIELGVGDHSAGFESGCADAAYQEAVGGALVSVQPEVVASGAQVIRRLFRYLWPYRASVVIGFLAAVLVALIGLAPPYLSGRLLDSVLSGSGENGFLRGAWVIVWLITGAVACRAVFLWLRLHLMSVLGEKVARDLRRDVYGNVQNLSLGYFSKTQTGTVVSRVGADTDRIWEFVTFGLAEVILSGLTLLAIGSILLILDWRLGLIMMAPVPILVWAIVRNGRGVQGRFAKAWRHWSSLNAVIADTIPGIRVVKSFGQEGRERTRFEKANDAVYETFNETHASWTRFWPMLLLALHGIGLTVYWVALPRLGGSGVPLTPGTFVSFLLFSWMFVQPLESFAQMGRMVNRALSSARRVFELLDTAPEERESGEVAPRDPVRGEVEFKDVWFGYRRFQPVLRGVSFEVSPGEIVGIVGRSGAGKSTLVQLIPRFFAPDKGGVFLDGADVSKLCPEALRREIGIVDQDPFLFHGTVLDNIRYGKPEASLPEVIAAARAADAHAFICGLSLGYETMIGERGMTLSGGERQRISLARALLPKPKILIFDEATCNVDGESEARIHDGFRDAAAGCTTFVIAHRLAALRRVHRILVLDEGVIQGDGTFEELQETNSTFRRLYENQMGSLDSEEDLR